MTVSLLDPGLRAGRPVCTAQDLRRARPAYFSACPAAVLPPRDGRPTPTDQMILADMFHEGLERASRVLRGIR